MPAIATSTAGTEVTKTQSLSSCSSLSSAEGHEPQLQKRGLAVSEMCTGYYGAVHSFHLSPDGIKHDGNHVELYW